LTGALHCFRAEIIQERAGHLIEEEVAASRRIGA
jgi:hypothetical protein